MPLHQDIKSLAFQVDRKVLQLEEEDFVRLDIPAKEKLNLKPLQRKDKIPREKSFLREATQFTASTAFIFGIFFLASNGPSYFKILQTNLLASAPPTSTENLITLPETFTADPQDGLLPVLSTPTNIQNRIEIPSIEVDARIVEVEGGVNSLVGQDWNLLESQLKTALKEGVVHYPGTAEAGERGNFFLTGHSSNVFWEQSPYNKVFATLPSIQVGDLIYVTYEQKQFTYRVSAKEEVTPEEVSVLKQGDGKTLSLLTCVPVGTRLKRLHVTAELVED